MIWLPAKTGHTSPAHLQDMLTFLHINYPQYWLSPLANLNTVADLGEGPGGSGPPLFLNQTEAPRAEKVFFGDRAPSWIHHWNVPTKETKVGGIQNSKYDEALQKALSDEFAAERVSQAKKKYCFCLLHRLWIPGPDQ